MIKLVVYATIVVMVALVACLFVIESVVKQGR